jgi:glycine betaine/proline transport system substrate-binding protein
MNIKFTTKVFGAVAGALLLSTSANAACGKITIADMNWNSASLMANVDSAILTAMGCETELVVGATTTTWASMDATGSPDVAPELWANAMADLLDSAVAAGRVHIGNTAPMSGLGEGWWIDPVTRDANPELTTVEAVIARPDLFPDKEDPSKGAFMGCPAGWGCQLASINLFRAHDMEAKGWKLLDPGSAAGLDADIARAGEQGEPWFGYYWAPTTMIGKYDLQSVDLGPFAGDDNWNGCIALAADLCADPQISGWTESRVNTIVSDNFKYTATPAAMEYFAARVYPGEVMNSMLVWMDANQAGGADAMNYFLQTYPEVWNAWVDDETQASVEAAM